MEFQVLGPIQILRDGQRVHVPGVLLRTLTAMLLARAGKSVSVSVETLTNAMWPAGPDVHTTNKLQVHVSRLRALLGDPQRLSFEQDSYR